MSREPLARRIAVSGVDRRFGPVSPTAIMKAAIQRFLMVALYIYTATRVDGLLAWAFIALAVWLVSTYLLAITAASEIHREVEARRARFGIVP